MNTFKLDKVFFFNLSLLYFFSFFRKILFYQVFPMTLVFIVLMETSNHYFLLTNQYFSSTNCIFLILTPLEYMIPSNVNFRVLFLVMRHFRKCILLQFHITINYNIYIIYTLMQIGSKPGCYTLEGLHVLFLQCFAKCPTL